MERVGEAVLFTASAHKDTDLPADTRNVVMFEIDIARNAKRRDLVTRHDRGEFEAWCYERALLIWGDNCDVTGLFMGEVFFETEAERIEFRVRWGV